MPNRRVVLVVLASLLHVACNSGPAGSGPSPVPTQPTPAPDGPSSFVLLGTEPPAGTPLRVGTEVTLTSRFRYTLGVDGGGLGCQAFAEGRGLSRNVVDIIPRTTDKVAHCSATFTVPAGARQIDFVTALAVRLESSRSFDFQSTTTFPIE